MDTLNVESNASIRNWTNNRTVVWTRKNQIKRNVAINRQIVSALNRFRMDNMSHPPPHSSAGSCKGLQRSQGIYQDGEYSLTVRGRKVSIYCHNMNTSNPQEYITLSGIACAFNYTLLKSNYNTYSFLCVHRLQRKLFGILWTTFTWQRSMLVQWTRPMGRSIDSIWPNPIHKDSHRFAFIASDHRWLHI